jgi:TPR repeat protein
VIGIFERAGLVNLKEELILAVSRSLKHPIIQLRSKGILVWLNSPAVEAEVAKVNLKTIFAVVLTLSISPAVAGPFEDGSAAYARGDYVSAFQLFHSLATQGNANGQYSLGFMYFNGQGVLQNFSEAMKWYRLAADQGHPIARLNLGVMHYKGQGVPQNVSEAVKWYRLAADQGNAKAQTFLGFMYFDGQGVPQNFAEAVKWYRRAADQGKAPAQLKLGVMHQEGRGVSQDFIRAHMWSNLAAAQGDQEATENRNLIAKSMTTAQIAKAQKLAREWKTSPPR